MQHCDFSIGLEFWCGARRWRCTDIGTRVIVAVCMEPREIVALEARPNDKTSRSERRFLSEDPRDLDGPPYGIVENVFDEFDMDACSSTAGCAE
jgi:hypothetical protein